MNDKSILDTLRELFPGNHPIEPDPAVAAILLTGETVVWQGRMVTQAERQAKLLWFKLPFNVLDDANEMHMPDTTSDWNLLEIRGLGGVSFTLEAHDGPLETTFEEQLGEVKNRREENLPLQQQDVIRQGPFNGFSLTIDYTEKRGFKWQDGAVRRIWLGSADGHFDVYASVSDPGNATGTDALDAIVASIGGLE